MSKIQQELEKATGLSPNKGESNEDFRARLTDLLDDAKKFSQEDFDALSDAAQKWSNVACTALGNGKPIPPFSDDDEVKGNGNGKATSAKEDAEESEEKVAKKNGKKAAKPKTEKVAKTKDLKKAATTEEKPKAAKKEKAPKKETKKEGGKGYDLKRFILDKPERSNQELAELMKKKGHTITLSTLSTIRSGFLNSLQVVIDAGRLKDAK